MHELYSRPVFNEWRVLIVTATAAADALLRHQVGAMMNRRCQEKIISGTYCIDRYTLYQVCDMQLPPDDQSISKIHPHTVPSIMTKQYRIGTQRIVCHYIQPRSVRSIHSDDT